MTRIQNLYDKARATHDGNSMLNAMLAKDIINGLGNVRDNCALLDYAAVSCHAGVNREAYRKRIAALDIEGTIDRLIRGIESVAGCMIEENMESFAKAQANVKGGAI